jgi:hypothetical protein
MGRRGTFGEPDAEFGVVRCPSIGRQQTNPGGGDLVEQTLGIGGVPGVLKPAQMRHLAIGGEADHVIVGFKELDPQQPIVVRRLLPWRDSKPVVVRVERHV